MLTAIAIAGILFACCCVMGGFKAAKHADDQADAMLRADTKFRRIRDSERAASATRHRRERWLDSFVDRICRRNDPFAEMYQEGEGE